jgi:phospholipid/cholesterol/gamma-HCH transport system substrate-binding protein
MPVSYAGALVRRRTLGALILLGAVLLAYTLWKRPNPLVHRETVRAELRDADGLAPIGADVRVAGVPVGRVSSITRVGSDALLTMTIDSSVGVVHADATAALAPRLLFEGTAYVELTLGSPAARPLGDAVIPVSRTSTYVPLEDVFSILQPATRADVRTVSHEVAGVLSATAPSALRGTLAAAPALTRDAAVIAGSARGSHQTELRSAVASLAQVASAAAAQSPAIATSLGDTATTARAAEVSGGVPLGRTLAALPGTTAELSSGAGAATAIVTQLQRLVPALQPGVEALTPTLAAVRPLLRRSLPVLSELDPVLGSAQSALAGAIRGAGPALAAMHALAPTLGIFQNSLLGALEQPTDLGDPAYLAFLGLFAGGGGASRPFGVDGQGHFMRFGLRFLTGAGQPLPPCTLVTQLSPSLATLLGQYGACTP